MKSSSVSCPPAPSNGGVLQVTVFVVLLALAGLPSLALAQQENPLPLVNKRVESPADVLPSATVGFLRTGDGALGRGDLNAAVGQYVRATQSAPDALLPRLLAGVTLTSAQRLKLAQTHFQAAHKLAESDLLTTFLLIGALESVGDAASAQELYLQTARDPRFRAAQRPGFDASGSLAYLQQASASFPKSPVIPLLIGDAQQLMGKLPEAERAYRQSLALAPRWIKPRLNLARLQIAQGQPQRAVETVEGALRQDPANVPARIAKGEALVRAGKPKEAIIAVQSLSHIDNVSVLTILAQASLSQGKLGAADTYAARARRTAPRDPGVRVVQGVVRSKQGDFAGAASAFGQALQLTRESGLFDAQPSLFRALAEAQLSAGRPVDALSTLKEAAEQEPDLTSIWGRLSASAHESLGDRVALEENLHRALQAERGLSAQETLLAISRRSLSEKFVGYYLTQREAARTGATPSKEKEIACLAALGYLYHGSDNASREVSVRRELCALRGSGMDWMLLADAQERLGELVDARTSYQKALSQGGLARTVWDRAKARLKALEK
jgi:tetratricopeptide (TPR) repeat protein